MAFNSQMHVVRTYGRHKKRTITAWISPEANPRTQHIFSSPEAEEGSITAPTENAEYRPAVWTLSSDEKGCSSLSDQEWLPGKKAGRQARKPLKESNVSSTQAKKKPATRKGTSRKQVSRTGKENLVEESPGPVDDLPPTARGKKVTKLSHKWKGKQDSRSSSQDDGGAESKLGRRQQKNVVAKFGLVHTPIDRSLRSSSKRGRREPSDITLDTSCDLFNYSADVSEAGSCANDTATVAISQKASSDDSVFGSPTAFPVSRQKGRNHDFLETSTPNDIRNCPTKTVKLSKDLPHRVSERQVTKSSHRGIDISGALNSANEAPKRTESPISISDGETRQATGDHRSNCRCLACKTRRLQTPDLFDITSEISLLDLNNSSDAKSQRLEDSSKRSLSVNNISPCSVVVTPLTGNCLSRFSTSSMLSSRKEDEVEETEKDNREIQDGSIQELKSRNLASPNHSKNLVTSDSYHHSFKEALTPSRSKTTGQLVTARQKVLQQCGQTSPIPFSQGIPPAMMRRCVKIGEGVYGEVFRTINASDETVALKIIPIEGTFEVNGEPQKSFEEILPEIVISRELSALKGGCANATAGFITVNSVSCCQGCYPKLLLEQWDEYNLRKESENDRPDLFPNDQLFIVFEFADGGIDLESKRLDSLHQAVSILQQVAVSLAVAEQSLEYEHRDLHWGNVLILPTAKETISFRLGGEEIRVASHGVQVGLIDFTLSRLKKDGCTVYCDLSNDETLFTGCGDLQFDIYRKMKDENDNDWEAWNPHTNVLWLHYLHDKLLNSKTYPRTRSDSGQPSLRRELRSLGRHLLGHSSAEEVATESGLVDL